MVVGVVVAGWGGDPSLIAPNPWPYAIPAHPSGHPPSRRPSTPPSSAVGGGGRFACPVSLGQRQDRRRMRGLHPSFRPRLRSRSCSRCALGKKGGGGRLETVPWERALDPGALRSRCLPVFAPLRGQGRRPHQDATQRSPPSRPPHLWHFTPASDAFATEPPHRSGKAAKEWNARTPTNPSPCMPSYPVSMSRRAVPPAWGPAPRDGTEPRPGPLTRAAPVPPFPRRGAAGPDRPPPPFLWRP